MPLGQGWQAQVGVGHESTWGTPVARTNFIDMVDVSGGVKYPLIMTDTFRGRSPRNLFRGAQLVEASIASELQYQGWEDFFYHLFGKVDTSTVNLIYQHIFSFDDTVTMPKGLTVEIKYGDAAVILWEGCKVDSCDLDFDIDKAVRAQFGLLGETESTSTETTPTFPTAPLIMWDDVTIQQDTVSKDCVSAKVQISNGYNRDRRALGSTTVKEHTPGRRSIKGQIVADFEDTTTWWDLLMNDTAFQLTITGTSATSIPGSSPTDYYDFILDIPAVKLEAHDRPISSSGPIRQTMNFESYYGAAEMATLTITNARATVP